MCAFLDPRFKNLDPFIPKCERIDVAEEVKLELVSLAKKQCHTAPDAGSALNPVSNQPGDSSQSKEAEALEEPPPTKRSKPGIAEHIIKFSCVLTNVRSTHYLASHCLKMIGHTKF